MTLFANRRKSYIQMIQGNTVIITCIEVTIKHDRKRKNAMRRAWLIEERSAGFHSYTVKTRETCFTCIHRRDVCPSVKPCSVQQYDFASHPGIVGSEYIRDPLTIFLIFPYCALHTSENMTFALDRKSSLNKLVKYDWMIKSAIKKTIILVFNLTVDIFPIKNICLKF